VTFPIYLTTKKIC